MTLEAKDESAFALALHALYSLIKHVTLNGPRNKHFDTVPSNESVLSHIHALPTLKIQFTSPVRNIAHSIEFVIRTLNSIKWHQIESLLSCWPVTVFSSQSVHSTCIRGLVALANKRDFKWRSHTTWTRHRRCIVDNCGLQAPISMSWRRTSSQLSSYSGRLGKSPQTESHQIVFRSGCNRKKGSNLDCPQTDPTSQVAPYYWTKPQHPYCLPLSNTLDHQDALHLLLRLPKMWASKLEVKASLKIKSFTTQQYIVMNDDDQRWLYHPTRYSLTHGARFIQSQTSAQCVLHLYQSTSPTEFSLQHVTVIFLESFLDFLFFFARSKYISQNQNFVKTRLRSHVRLWQNVSNYDRLKHFPTVHDVQNDAKQQFQSYCTYCTVSSYSTKGAKNAKQPFFIPDGTSCPKRL